jgi:hypothetical protein
LFLPQVRVEGVELFHLAERTPAVVAVSRVAEIGVGDRLEAPRQIKPRGDLMGQTLVLHEAVLPGRLNRLLVEVHRIEGAVLDASDFGGEQRGAVGEILGAALGPRLELLLM